MLPVHYKGKRFPFNLNLPWLKATFSGAGVPTMIEDEVALKLVAAYPGSYFIGTNGEEPEEKPKDTEQEEWPEIIEPSTPASRYSHLVLDFKNMGQGQVAAFVLRFWGERFPNTMTKQRMFDWVIEKMENMAEEDRPTLVNHHQFMLKYLERKMNESGKPILEAAKS